MIPSPRFQVKICFNFFSANQSPSHDIKAVHAASNQERRRTRINRQTRGSCLLSVNDASKVVVHGTQEKDPDRGPVARSRIAITKFCNRFESHESCHAIQKSKKLLILIVVRADGAWG